MLYLAHIKGCESSSVSIVQVITQRAAHHTNAEQDALLAQKRLNEASEFAGHVEGVAQLHLDSRKSEALWLMTSKSRGRSLDFDAKVVNSKRMKLLAERLEAKTKCICEKLLERALDDDDWTRMKLATSLGGMGIRAVTSQLETSLEITVKKTRVQADRIEKSLPGKQKDTSFESGTKKKYQMWDGAPNVEHEERTGTMTGPFKWDLVNASKGDGFSSSISRTLKTHEIITAHKIWSRLDVPEKAAYPANCGRCWCDMDGNCARAGNAGRGVENGGQTEAAAQD